MPQIDVPGASGDPANAWYEAHLAYAPEIGKAATELSMAVYQHSKLSLRELEGARYRTALINGCIVCTNTRGGRDLPTLLAALGGRADEGPLVRGPAPDEAFYEAVTDWATSPLFSERERIAIELAERMGERPHSMSGDDAFWVRVHKHFTDAEILDMTMSIGSWIALGRMVHTLEFDNVCMPTFGEKAA